MSRITDSYKPGYDRVALGEIGKTAPPDGSRQTGSAVLNQAMAEVLGAKSIAAAPVPPAFRYFRTVFVDDAVGSPGLVVWNEVEFWSGPDISGSKQPVSLATHQGVLQVEGYTTPDLLIDGVTEESGSGGKYAAMWNPLAGCWWQFDLGQVRAVKSIALYVFTSTYWVRYVHVDGSVDGTNWTRLVASKDIRAPGTHLVVVNLP